MILEMAEKEEHGIVSQYIKRHPELHDWFCELTEIRSELKRQQKKESAALYVVTGLLPDDGEAIRDG